MTINPLLMVARKNFPANDLRELVAWMKAHPGEAKLANITATNQVVGLLFQQSTGTRLQFIPYRGAGPAMTDLISGQVLDLWSPLPLLHCPKCGVARLRRLRTSRRSARRRCPTFQLRMRVP